MHDLLLTAGVFLAGGIGDPGGGGGGEGKGEGEPGGTPPGFVPGELDVTPVIDFTSFTQVMLATVGSILLLIGFIHVGFRLARVLGQRSTAAVGTMGAASASKPRWAPSASVDVGPPRRGSRKPDMRLVSHRDGSVRLKDVSGPRNKRLRQKLRKGKRAGW